MLPNLCNISRGQYIYGYAKIYPSLFAVGKIPYTTNCDVNTPNI